MHNNWQTLPGCGGVARQGCRRSWRSSELLLVSQGITGACLQDVELVNLFQELIQLHDFVRRQLGFSIPSQQIIQVGLINWFESILRQSAQFS